jgi:16S rRNA U1498 N3-methylase RsmE
MMASVVEWLTQLGVGVLAAWLVARLLVWQQMRQWKNEQLERIRRENPDLYAMVTGRLTPH